MLMDGEDKKQKPVGHAEIRQDGYLYVDDSINFFTGELQVNGRQQSFVLGVPVKYETDTNGRKYAIAIQRPDPVEIRKFLFDISDTTTIEMSIDGNDNDERYATYFYYGANGICQHSAFSDKSGHNVMIESDYDAKGRVIKYCHHGENWIAKISYEQDRFHLVCNQSAGSDGTVLKDVYGNADGLLEGFVMLLGEKLDVDGLNYVGAENNRIIPGTNYNSLVWNIIDFNMDDWAIE